VSSTERKNKKHFDSPWTDASHGSKSLDDFGFGHFQNRAGSWNDAFEGFGGDVLERGGFRAGKTGAAQFFFADIEYLLRAGKAHTGEKLFQAPEDRRRSGSIELLIDHRLDK